MRKKFLIALIALSLVFMPQLASAASLQDQINALNAEIAKNQEVLHGVSHQASTLQAKVDGLNAEISQLQNQIDLANLQIEQTTIQINETIAKLEKQKRIMFENAKVLYKQGDPSTIEVLASSDNFTDFVNKQEYLERVKEAVNKAAREFVVLKGQLEEKQTQLKDFVKGQEVQIAIIDNKRQEQASLLSQTRGEEAAYQGLVADLEARREAAQQQALALTGGSGAGMLVQPGQHVSAGQTIGYVGSTGLSTGSHLHFAKDDGNGYVDPEPYLNSGVVWPVPGYTSIDPGFGSIHCSDYTGCSPPGSSYYIQHRGADIAAPYGRPVLATEAGTVIFSGWGGDFGNLIKIQHPGGYVTFYPHLN